MDYYHNFPIIVLIPIFQEISLLLSTSTIAQHLCIYMMIQRSFIFCRNSKVIIPAQKRSTLLIKFYISRVADLNCPTYIAWTQLLISTECALDRNYKTLQKRIYHRSLPGGQHLKAGTLGATQKLAGSTQPCGQSSSIKSCFEIIEI